MDACIIQPWTTIAGKQSVGSIAQSSHEYLDIGQHEDLTFYLDVRQLTGLNVNMLYETSPTMEDNGFLPMILPFAVSATGLLVSNAFFSMAAVPPARFVRWRLTSTGGVDWKVTFRLWVAAYAFA